MVRLEGRQPGLFSGFHMIGHTAEASSKTAVTITTTEQYTPNEIDLHNLLSGTKKKKPPSLALTVQLFSESCSFNCSC